MSQLKKTAVQSTSDTRTIRCEFSIDTDITSVFKALTQAEHLRNWFAPYAESRTGADGYIKLGWKSAEGMEQITFSEWTENEHINLNWHAAPPGAEDQLLPVDIRLQETEHGTLLKLVQSGFLTDASWDDEYDSHSRGWNTELRFLKYYLENQFGRVRSLVRVKFVLPDGFADALTKVIGVDGVFRTDRPGLAEGDLFRLTMAGGQEIACQVLFELAGKDMVFLCDALDGGAIRVILEHYTGTAELEIWATSWHLAQDQLAKAVEPWFKQLVQQLGLSKETDRLVI